MNECQLGIILENLRGEVMDWRERIGTWLGPEGGL